MGIISLVIPQIGQPDTTEDVKVQNAFTAIQTVINGNIDRSNIAAGIARPLLTVKGANYAAVDGDLVEVTSGNPTITLPTPTANAMVGVFVGNGAVSGASPVTVTASSGSIAAAGTLSASRVLGMPYVGVLLVADGANWATVSGQWDTGWVTLGLASGWNGVGGFYVPAARKMGDRVWLRGQLQNSTGSGTATHSLPSGMTPTTSQLVTADAHFAGGDNSVVISTGGTLQANSSVPAAGFMGLDGSSYLLT